MCKVQGFKVQAIAVHSPQSTVQQGSSKISGLPFRVPSFSFGIESINVTNETISWFGITGCS